MGKKERFATDIQEELNLDLDSEEGIDAVLDKVEDMNMENLVTAIATHTGAELEGTIVAELVEAYNIDVNQDNLKPAAEQVFNVYQKEFS